MPNHPEWLSEIKSVRTQFLQQHQRLSEARNPERGKWFRRLGGIAVAWWIFVCGGLWFYYLGTRPSTINSETGNVYELNNHGQKAYLTRHDARVLNGSAAVPVVLIPICIVLWRRANPPDPL